MELLTRGGGNLHQVFTSVGEAVGDAKSVKMRVQFFGEVLQISWRGQAFEKQSLANGLPARSVWIPPSVIRGEFVLKRPAGELIRIEWRTTTAAGEEETEVLPPWVGGLANVDLALRFSKPNKTAQRDIHYLFREL